MEDQIECPFCLGPATKNCYAEHLLDPNNRIPSPELADALYGSIFPLLCPDSEPEDAKLASLEKGLDNVWLEEATRPFVSNNTAHRGAATGLNRQRHSVEPPCRPDRQDYAAELIPPHCCARAKANPPVACGLRKAYMEEMKECQMRACQALREIEKVTDQLSLTRKGGKEWKCGIAAGREVIWRMVIGTKTGNLDIETARYWAGTIEKVKLMVEVCLAEQKRTC
ncbi:hypothetical protein BJX76DRAFT_358072 [Aspergillus varians]